MAGFFSRLKERLTRSREALSSGVARIFSGRSTIDDAVYDELEELLIEADVGVQATAAILEETRQLVRTKRLRTPAELQEALKDALVEALSPEGDEGVPLWEVSGPKPYVTLIAGVNGSGKTTTAGKLAQKIRERGMTVVLGAADTFRAGAISQLGIWAERTGAHFVRHQEGADPGAVAYDAVAAGLARRADHVLIDTAGRLHNKANLMEELRKIRRVIRKHLPEAPHLSLLVMDATTGQNGLQQARVFTEALEISGITLTKLDGTARGGIAVAIRRELGLPIRYIGVGESAEDLQPFDPREFVNALFGGNEG